MTWLVNRKCFRSIFFNRNNNFIVISQICHQQKLFHEKLHLQTSKKSSNSSKFWKLKSFCASFCFKFLIVTQKTHGKFTRFFNLTVWLYETKYYEGRKHLLILKVRQSRQQIMVCSNLPKNERNALKICTILSAFRSFFGRIKETINCFRDLLTFIKTF